MPKYKGRSLKVAFPGIAKKPFNSGKGGYPPPPLTEHHQKNSKNGSKGLKLAFLADFFLNGIGGYTPALLTDNHCAQKSLAERGVPPPLTGKIR